MKEWEKRDKRMNEQLFVLGRGNLGWDNGE